MTQSRLASAVEAFINVAIGLCIMLVAQLIVYPLFGIHVSFKTNLGIVSVFTVISVTRSYLVRRAFNYYHGTK